MTKEEFLSKNISELLTEILNGVYTTDLSNLSRKPYNPNSLIAQIQVENLRFEVVWNDSLNTKISVFRYNKSIDFWEYLRNQRRGFTPKKVNKTIIGYLTQMKKELE